MLRLLRNLFSGIFGFLAGIVGFGKKSKTPPLDPSTPQSEKATITPASGNGRAKSFFLEGDEARSFTTAEPKPAASVQKQETRESLAASGQTLNLPAPKFTARADLPTSSDRRRPGANMQSYLNMARQLKTSR